MKIVSGRGKLPRYLFLLKDTSKVLCRESRERKKCVANGKGNYKLKGKKKSTKTPQLTSATQMFERIVLREPGQKSHNMTGFKKRGGIKQSKDKKEASMKGMSVITIFLSEAPTVGARARGKTGER